MAKKKKPSGDDPAKKKNELPEWLRTDDWLQVTPTPPAKGLPETPSGRIPVGLPPSKDDQPTDMIQLDEDENNVALPPSTMLFSDPDDSVILSDDILSPGPLSGKLKPSSSSSLRLPKVKADEHADADIDLAAMPEAEHPHLAGPPTSSVGLGQPVVPTQPASGWLANSGTKLAGGAEPPTAAGTWADLSTPDAKAESRPGSWHPSSGDVNLPSASSIDLPPDVADAGASDIFSDAKPPVRPAGPPPADPPPPARKPPEAAKPEPATPSLHLPDLPADAGKASWHPSSGNVNLPSTADIDLPPDAAAARPPEPQWLETTHLDVVQPAEPASGWLSGHSNAGKPAKPPETPAGLIATSADVRLPSIGDPEPSDIFSTARPAAPAAKGESALYTGAEAPDSSFFRDLPPHAAGGESNLFHDPTDPEQPTGLVSLVPPDNVSPVLPASKTDAVDLNMPAADDASGVEVFDTSDALAADAPPTGPESAILKAEPIIDDTAPPDEEFGEGLDLLDAEPVDDEPDAGRADFNIFPGHGGSDSNLLGDRTFVEADLYNPHSSGVNLADPNALSRDPTADSGQASSIFNKPDQPSAGGGRVDLDSIPLMGSSDDGTLPLDADGAAVLGGRLDDPHAGDLEASVFDVAMPKAAGDSGMIDWSSEEAKPTDRLGDASNRQPTMQRTLRTEIPEEDEEPPRPAARRVEVKRPISRPDLDLDAGAKGTGKGGLLYGALGLLLGAGVGAAAMFLAGGSGDPKPSTANAVADPGVQKKADDLQGQVKTLEATVADQTKTNKDLERLNGDLNAQLLGVKNVEQTLTRERDTAVQQSKLDKQKATDDVAAAKKKGEDDVVAAKKAAEDDVAAAKKKADDADATAKKLEDDKTKLLADVKKATDQATELMATVGAAKRRAKEQADDLALTIAQAKKAEAKLKAADASLDPVLDKLKAAKLIDSTADREKALAALPEALKKANLITGDGEAGKLAKELTDARDALKKQKDDADKAVAAAEKKAADADATAKKQAADAKEASDKAVTDLMKKVETADARIKGEVEKAVAAAKKDSDAEMKKALDQAGVYKEQATKAMADARAEKETAKKAADDRIAELTEQFQKQMAAVKSGAVVPLNNDAFAGKAEEAAAAFDRGTAAYFASRYADAETAFAAAAKADQTDARYWYYLGLSKYAQGKTKEADADFKTGAGWESSGKPGRRVVATALESIQGPARTALEAARP